MDALESYAEARGESISHVARRFIRDGLTRAADPDRGAISEAIAVLEAVRDHTSGRQTG